MNVLNSCYLFEIDLEEFLRRQLLRTISSFVSFHYFIVKMEFQIYIFGFGICNTEDRLNNDLRKATACGMQVRYKLYLIILNCVILLFTYLGFSPSLTLRK